MLIGGEDREAWETELNWGDWETIGTFTVPTTRLEALSLTFSAQSDQYPAATMKSFIKLFPDAPMAAFIRGFLKFFGLEDPPPEEEETTGKETPAEKKQRRRKLAEAKSPEAMAEEQNAAFSLLLVRPQ